MELLHERLRGHVSYIRGIRIADIDCSLSVAEANAIADEIEDTYITKEQHEREINEIVEAQGGGFRSLHHIMKTYAEQHGMPMKDSETITQWLDRWKIDRPRYEDGEPMYWGDEVEGLSVPVTAFTIHSDGSGCVGDWRIDEVDWVSFDNSDDLYLKRPQPKVYDADGVEIKVGDTIFSELGNEYRVGEIYDENNIYVYSDDKVGFNFEASYLSHQKPVLDAYGVRIKVGDRVWRTIGNYPWRVDKITTDGRVGILDDDGLGDYADPKNLTHKEPDSLEKLQYDIAHCIGDYEEWASRLKALNERGA